MSQPLDATLQRVLQALDQTSGLGRRVGGQWRYRCPAHPDDKPSLTVDQGEDDRVLLHCHAGCPTEQIVSELGLTIADLFVPKPTPNGKVDATWTPAGPAIAVYDYTDEHGTLLYQVLRTADKQFRQRRPDPGAKSGYRWSLGGVKRVLYRLPEVLQALERKDTIYLVEGEKDADAIVNTGAVATTASGGADNVHLTDLTILRDADLIAVVDRDEAGAGWMTKVQAVLPKARFVQAATGKDAADHLAAGHTLGQLQPIVVSKPGFDRLIGGREFLYATLDDQTPVWGTTRCSIWAPGESLMIFGPPGLGKSTLSHLLVWARLSIERAVLGHPVHDDGGKVLYIAADRPGQIRRAMRRLTQHHDQEQIGDALDRLIVHWGPLPVNISQHKDWLADYAQELDATTIVIDSIKDVCLRPSNEEDANGYNLARQEATARGIQWLENHHNRKAGAENKTPNTLDDVYGNRWLTAGAGSVVCIWGDAGDTIARLTQLKSSNEVLEPINLFIDYPAGQIRAEQAIGLGALLAQAGRDGLTLADAAEQLEGTRNLSKSQKEKTRVKLMRLVARGLAETYEHNDGLLRYRQTPAARPQQRISEGYQQDGLDGL